MLVEFIAPDPRAGLKAELDPDTAKRHIARGCAVDADPKAVAARAEAERLAAEKAETERLAADPAEAKAIEPIANKAQPRAPKNKAV